MSLSLQEVSLSGHGLRLPGKGTEHSGRGLSAIVRIVLLLEFKKG